MLDERAQGARGVVAGYDVMDFSVRVISVILRRRSVTNKSFVFGGSESESFFEKRPEPSDISDTRFEETKIPQPPNSYF